MLLVGSKALAYYYNEYTHRTYDTDVIATYDEYLECKDTLNIKKIYPTNRGKTIVAFTTNNIIEFEIAWEDSSAAKLLNIASEDINIATIKYVKEFNKEILVGTPDLIFTLKKSHRFLKDSPHFIKTREDYLFLRDECKCDIPNSLKEWYKIRTKETYWYNHPNLNVSKKDFFNLDDIPYIYDHDSIHLAMANLDKPAYEYFKENDAEVKCSKILFEKLPEETKLFAVLEEAYVLALERSQIPFPKVWTPVKSFTIALQKICSSITSGWFREYAYENYDKVLNIYDDNYVNKFWKAVDLGIVKKIEST